MKALLISGTILLLAGCSTYEEWRSDEQDIELAAVPAAVLRAAEQAVPGIELTSAQQEREDGEIVYELEGMLDGEEYEIEVNLSAEVLDVEKS